MLKFNPLSRIEPRECLLHQFFDGYLHTDDYECKEFVQYEE